MEDGSGEANPEKVILPKGGLGCMNCVKPRPKEPRKRGKCPSGYVEIKLAVKNFYCHILEKGSKGSEPFKFLLHYIEEVK